MWSDPQAKLSGTPFRQVSGNCRNGAALGPAYLLCKQITDMTANTMSPVPETTEATDQPPKPRRRIRYLRLVGICVVVFVIGMFVIQWWQPWLNDSERRMIGVWTWQDAPGKVVSEYREDGTMRYVVDYPQDSRINFARWSIEGDKHVVEFSQQNPLQYMYSKHWVHRVNRNAGFSTDFFGIIFRSDGTISFTLEDGKSRVLIPWSSKVGDALKQSD